MNKIFDRGAVHGAVSAPRPLTTTAAAVVGSIQLARFQYAGAREPAGRPPPVDASPAGLIPITAWRTSPAERRVGRDCVAPSVPPRCSVHRPGRSFHDPERGFADRLKALAFVVTHSAIPTNFSRRPTSARTGLREQSNPSLRLAHEHGRGAIPDVGKLTA